MADDRTFTLIGNFTDNITPALEKINRSLAQTKRAFESFGSKRGGVDNLTKNLGKVIGAHKKLTTEVGNLRSEMQKSFSTIKEYNRLMGKAVGANRRMQQSTAQAFGQQARDIGRTNAQLRQYQALSRRVNRGGGGGGYGGGGGPTRRPPGPPGPPRAPRAPRMGGGGGPIRRTDGGGSSFGESVTAYAVGQRVSTVVEEGIMAGFRMGVALFQTTFKYIGDSFQERIEDQMTDLQAAGGNLSIAKRQKNPFVKNLTDSIRFTQTTNKVLDKLANDLPGSNQDYIEVGKRISDSVSTLVDYNKKGAMEFAKQLQVGNEEVYKNQQIKGDGGSQDVKNTITTIIGELTKKTVIGGFGGSVGAGGIRGPNSLAGIMERIITNPELTLAKVSKYASTFDPKVLSALKRAFPKLDEAGDDLLKRAKIVNEMLDEIANPSMIEASKRTVAGVLESYRGTFFSPESGLLGFGRKLGEANKGTAPMIDEMGRYIRMYVKDGQQFFEVVKNASEATKENLSIFEMIGDLMANYGSILKPLADNLYLIFDPLSELGNVLQEARDYSIIVFQQFKNYAAGMENIAKGIGDSDLKNAFLQTKNFRASLLTLTNLFTNMGIFSEGDFSRLQKILIDPTKGMKDLGKVFNEIVSTFFNSEAAKELGVFFGTLLGTIAVELAKMTGFFAKKIGGGKLTEGFVTAFNAAGGQQAVIQIFEDIQKVLFDALMFVLSEIDWKVYLVAGGLLVIPALIQGLVVGIVKNLSKGFKAYIAKSLKESNGAIKAAFKGKSLRDRRKISGKSAGFRQTSAENMRSGASKNASFRTMPRAARANALFPNVALPGGVLPGVSGVTGPFKPPSLPKNLVNPPKIRGAGKMGAASAAINGVFAFQNAVTGTGNVLKKVVKTVGKVGIAFTALDFGLRVFSGENLGTAALGAGGSLAGGAIGAVVGQTLLPFLPGIGAIIGSIVGAFLGDWAATQLPTLFNNFPAKMTAAFTAVTKWFDEAPAKFGDALGKFTIDVELWWSGLEPYFQSLADRFGNWVLKLETDLGREWSDFITSVQTGGTIDWNKLGTVLSQKLSEAFKLAMLAINPVRLGLEIAGNKGKEFLDAFNERRRKEKSEEQYYNDQYGTSYAGSPAKMHGSLGSAISSEMRNKPPGSDLVIANSSETVIPAAGGYGVKELMDILVDGFSSIKKQYTSLATGVNDLDKKTSKGFQTVNKTIDTNQNQNQQEFAKINQNFQQLSTKVSSMSMGGMGDMGGLGAGYGSAGGQIAGQLGNFIKQTGGAPGSIHEHPQHGGVKYKHAPGSYHYQGRAIDIGGYANEQAGILRRIAQFNAMYGVKPVELFHAGNDPKGHSDHVHVAYAGGAGNPAFFSSRSAAERWERSMAPSSSSIRSFTANSSEGLGGTINGGINVTVHAGSTSDPNQLAEIVARKIGQAVSEVQSSSLFV